ncbi:Na+/H+ antiporter subunit E [Roseococcus thiosulfatophilus]|uniref:Na+/H+ antiporter subunit E n=1 Tax=Roseococcus thiosulfatophilus TaxID=35813 RepID=UPI001A8E15C3|nr:Na+/H+ antiporter subunit E [Roseococcus thiosulfatophilus]
MRRVLPFPWVSAALLLLWLLLVGSMGPGALLLGAALALVGGWLLAVLDPPRTRLRRPLAALRLAWVVLVEVFRSNNAVARLILAPRTRGRSSGFVRIPLDMRSPAGLAALACILTATPGTVWAEYDSARGIMLLHVLDLIDEAEWVRIIKDRYEARLMEIFE